MVLDHRRGTMLACTATALMLISGCADDPPPSTLPDVTPTAAQPRADTTESAEPTPSTDPTATLEAEVEDFIRTYITTVNASWGSDGALDQRREMFADECAICLSGYEMVRDANSKGHKFRGEPSEILDVEVLDVDGERATALVRSDVPRADLLDSGGSVVETFPASPGIQVLYDLYKAEGTNWIVIRIEVV